MCGVCTSTAGMASTAASVSITLTACVIVGRLRFLPSSTISFRVRVSGPLGVVVMTVLMKSNLLRRHALDRLDDVGVRESRRPAPWAAAAAGSCRTAPDRRAGPGPAGARHAE